ncbi:hypothetical protein VCHA54P489_130048 [Vibrio chagasii]|nr:hypothetical protein VCHA34P112_160046 [Vibrio chagasii]CAH6830126.1 hypothetical protein VCHA34O109_150089 [Vibrio chagasii]CAH6913610.1 hypothetical protein VCHA34P116_30087 [Vibrio chagasii]CAH6922786.1 hypothetical protein VCHA32P90_30088 [Vibrio chagasii]CAH6927446.1 hypothetical protein VCHA54P489_130048 [Vibrio chagasii]
MIVKHCQDGISCDVNGSDKKAHMEWAWILL